LFYILLILNKILRQLLTIICLYDILILSLSQYLYSPNVEG